MNENEIRLTEATRIIINYMMEQGMFSGIDEDLEKVLKKTIAEKSEHQFFPSDKNPMISQKILSRKSYRKH